MISRCQSTLIQKTVLIYRPHPVYSFSGNSAALAPISTFMCLWTIYIFPVSVYIFPPAEQADPSWEYIIRSLTHEFGNCDWGPDIPFLGIFVSNFRHFVFAVHMHWGEPCRGLICRWPKELSTRVEMVFSRVLASHRGGLGSIPSRDMSVSGPLV